MPTIACPACRTAVNVPDDGNAYTCPHCRKPISTAPAKSRGSFNFDAEDDEREARNRRPRASFRHRERGNALGDLFTFRAMLTPIIITTLFWVGAVLNFLFGVLIVISAFNAKDREAGEYRPYIVVAGAVYAVVSPIVLRIVCELFIVVFKIHDELKELNDAK